LITHILHDHSRRLRVTTSNLSPELEGRLKVSFAGILTIIENYSLDNGFNEIN